MSPIRRVRPSTSSSSSPRSPRPSLYTAAYRRVRRRRAAGWVLVGVGGIMAVVHMGTHLGRLHLLGYQDLLIGYPMAVILGLGGLLLIGFAAKA